MSLITGARSYAAVAVDRSKSAVTTAPGRVVAIAGVGLDRAGEVAGGTRTLVSSAAGVARKQTYAGMGITDALLASIIKRGAELPDDLKQGAAALADTATSGITAATELAAKAQSTVVTLTGAMNKGGGNLLGAVRKVNPRPASAIDARDKFADRGEQVATDLRRDPALVRVITTADELVEQVANDVTSAAQKLRSRAAIQADQENAAATSTPVRLAPARKVPSHKSTVRKTPAGQAPISATPTHRAVARAHDVRTDAAAKAADTRRRAALAKEQDADARKAAAVKAAATRKKNAELATAKRHATATKAAATRKKNAAATRKKNAVKTTAK